MNILADIIAVAYMGRACVEAGNARGDLLVAGLDTTGAMSLYWKCRNSLNDVGAAWGLGDLNPYTMRRCLAENVTPS